MVVTEMEHKEACLASKADEVRVKCVASCHHIRKQAPQCCMYAATTIFTAIQAENASVKQVSMTLIER